jgi:hypothetical protein
MTVAVATSIRTAFAQDIISASGASARLKYYNGTRPASGAAPAGTLLATLIAGSVIGVATAGVLDFSESSFTQTNSSHVSGTPTFWRIETSGGTWVADGSIPSDGSFTGSITTGIDITLGASTLTMPAA